MKKVTTNFAITLSIVGAMTAAILYLMQNSLFTVQFFSTNYLKEIIQHCPATLHASASNCHSIYALVGLFR